MNDYGLALSFSFFFLILFICGFWLGVHWQLKKENNEGT